MKYDRHFVLIIRQADPRASVHTYILRSMCMSLLTHVLVPGMQSFLFFNNNQVVKAPEPDNIIWENLEFSKFKRGMRQRLTGLVSFILLLIAFGLILAASGVQDHWSQIIPKIDYCQLEVNRSTLLRS